MQFELVIFVFGAFLLAASSFYIMGSVAAVKMLNKTIKVEKLAKEYGLDYKIRNKTLMYIICILFSWLAYSALHRVRG